MPNYRRSDLELLDALNEQREFLRRSCEAYDLGSFTEAKRIASAVYILCYDGKNRTKSLLGQLDLIKNTKFISSGKSLKSGEYPRTTLAGFAPSFGAFLPNFFILGGKKEQFHLDFDEWWNGTVFETVGKPINGNDISGIPISRKEFVYHLRSQDGGAHFDRDVNKISYIEFAIRSNSELSVAPAGTDDFKRVSNAHFATMRQIAWELEQTLSHIPGGPQMPPPEVVIKWHSNPPSQYQLGPGTPSIRLLISFPQDLAQAEDSG